MSALAVVDHPNGPEFKAQDLPSDFDAEEALIGIALSDAGAFDALGGIIKADHFHDIALRGVFEAWTVIRKRDGLATQSDVLNLLMDSSAVQQRANGAVYLAEVFSRSPPGCDAPEWAHKVIDAHMRRQLVKTGRELAAKASRPGAQTALDQAREVERVLSEITAGAVAKSAWRPAAGIVGQAVRDARARNGRIDLPTGLADLDRATGGFRRGEMAVIAARPSMGKSTALLALAKALASQRKGVAFFSMEMPEVALGLRMACDLAYSPTAPIFSGKSTCPSYFDADRGILDAHQWAELEDAEEVIAGWPLEFDCTPGQTVAQMEVKARRLFRDWQARGIEPGAVMVDHLTIARADQDRRGNKVAEVGDISRGLAELAKRLDVPAIVACQLSRDVEKRDGKDRRPTLSDLRWSGEIEQDARQVIFLYRPEYYLRRPEDKTDIEAELSWRDKLDKVRHKLFWLVEKNNNGPTGEVETHCNIACSAIRDRLGQ